MNKTVKDLMHQGLITCPPEASLGQVAVLLSHHRVHALIVADREDQPLGIISDFDLLAGEWLSVDSISLDAMRKMTARELMTSPIATIEASTLIVAASKTMIDTNVHRMLVTENGKPVGVISISNFVADIASQEKLKRETVGDVMSDAFLVCRDQTLVTSAARTITQAGWRSVLVVDSHGKPLGVVSGKNLIHYAGTNVGNLKVSDVMNKNLLTIDMNASLQEAANLMINNHRHRVIVIDTNDPESFPLGVISSVDIVAEMARLGSVWQR